MEMEMELYMKKIIIKFKENKIFGKREQINQSTKKNQYFFNPRKIIKKIRDNLKLWIGKTPVNYII